MTCAGCVSRVEGALRAVPGVAEARVSLATHTATLQLINGAALSNELLRAVRRVGYEAEPVREDGSADSGLARSEAESRRQHRQAVILAIGLSLPILALDLFGSALGSTHPGAHIWWRALQALLCAMLLRSPAGAPILVSGVRAMFYRTPNMDLLITLGVGASFLAGVASLLIPDLHAFHFHAAAMILTFVAVGRYLEARARHEASDAVGALARRMPREAVKVTPQGLRKVPVEDLAAGDCVQVAPDTAVPVDGVIETGEAALDESTLTGEAVPRRGAAGDAVRAGAWVREGLVTVRATQVGAQSTIGRILRAIEEAQSGKTDLQRLADRVAGVFVPIVTSLAGAALALWLWSPSWFAWLAGAEQTDRVAAALRAAVAVLVIACPCAMGLATPTAVLVATGRAALRGILVRDAAALERAGTATILCFDKTGTLTTGAPEVGEVVDDPLETTTQCADEVLRLAASVEQLSQHPFARAIVRRAQASNLSLLQPASFVSYPGRGVRAHLDGRDVLVGSESLAREHHVRLEDAIDHLKAAGLEGASVIVVAVDQACVGWITLMDRTRPEAPAAISELNRLGIKLVMMTGDHAPTACRVAAGLGIGEVRAELTPEGKMEEVRHLQGQGEVVAFAGDGINDGPALSAADVGVTFATGTDVAVGAADITILAEDLNRLPEIVHLARRATRIIKQNLFWAFAYNLAALPLAAMGHVPPAIAAAAMMGSSLTVVLNSLRLRKAKLAVEF